MRFAYEDSWQIEWAEKLHNNVATGRKYTPCFNTIKMLDNFIHSIPKNERILDIGCGHNQVKIWYPEWDIYGVDKTLEADMHGFSEDIDYNKMHYKHALAINSIHFQKKEQILSRIANIYNGLPKSGYFMFTINDFGEDNDYNYFYNYDWNTVDKVVGYYRRTPEMKKQMIKDFLNYRNNDLAYLDYIRDKKLEKTRNEITDLNLVKTIIDRDYFYGCLRIILQKTK